VAGDAGSEVIGNTCYERVQYAEDDAEMEQLVREVVSAVKDDKPVGVGGVVHLQDGLVGVE